MPLALAGQWVPMRTCGARLHAGERSVSRFPVYRLGHAFVPLSRGRTPPAQADTGAGGGHRFPRSPAALRALLPPRLSGGCRGPAGPRARPLVGTLWVEERPACHVQGAVPGGQWPYVQRERARRHHRCIATIDRLPLSSDAAMQRSSGDQAKPAMGALNTASASKTGFFSTFQIASRPSLPPDASSIPRR